jgi:hypothetical protein
MSVIFCPHCNFMNADQDAYCGSVSQKIDPAQGAYDAGCRSAVGLMTQVQKVN